MGAIAGLEACDVAWEAQTFLEQATLHRIAKVLAAYDYRKYFASFEHEFSCSMMAHAAMPPTLVAQTRHLYTNMKRVMKRGKALGQLFRAYSEVGEGDVLSLFPALVLASW